MQEPVERNKQIIADYVGGLKLPGLAKKYGVSRQRIHQILSREGIIQLIVGERHERREAEKLALQHVREKIKEAKQAKLDKAVDMVRKGSSIRKARRAVFDNISFNSSHDMRIAKACKKAGVRTKYGRWHGWAHRKKEFRGLIASGMGILEAIEMMRAKGSKIHYAWVYAHCPELRRRRTHASPPAINKVWSLQNIRRLLILRSEGYSAAQVAADLGPGFTRNNVLGKIYRLRVTNRLTLDAFPDK